MLQTTKIEVTTGVDLDYDPENDDVMVSVTTFVGSGDSDGLIQKFSLRDLVKELYEANVLDNGKFPNLDARGSVMNAAGVLHDVTDGLHFRVDATACQNNALTSD